MKQYRLPVAALLALLVASLRAELPPDAQSAMEKGVLAAQQQDFALAAKFFAEAREFAPEAPELLYNLGLAESKIPGRELRAIAWFGAYLAANPAAPNAKAVKKQMDALDVTSQINTTKFIKTVVDAAKLLHAPDHPNPGGLIMPYMGGPLHEAAVLLARNGETAEALKIAAAIKDPRWRSWAQAGIAMALALDGDRTGADKFRRLSAQTDTSFAPSNWDMVLANITGRIGPALKTIESDFAGTLKSGDRWTVLHAQLQRQTASSAQDWIALNTLVMSEPIFTDFTATLETLPKGKASDTFRALRYAASGILDLRAVVTRMMKMQRAKQIKS